MNAIALFPPAGTFTPPLHAGTLHVMSERVNKPRIGVCSWSLQPRDPGDLLAKLREVELNAVQLALGPIIQEPETWRDVVDALQDNDITILSGMMSTKGEDYSTLESIARTGGIRPDETWEDNRAHAEQIAQLAAHHHIGLITFHAGFIPEHERDPEYHVILERVRITADTFAARGIQLGLETGQETAQTLEAFVDALERPNVGVNFDPANMILYGMGDPVAALRRLGPWVRQIHIKDALPAQTPGTWGTEVPVGEGAVDFHAFLALARSLTREHDLVIEREAGENRLGDVRRAVQIIHAHLYPQVAPD